MSGSSSAPIGIPRAEKGGRIKRVVLWVFVAFVALIVLGVVSELFSGGEKGGAMTPTGGGRLAAPQCPVENSSTSFCIISNGKPFTSPYLDGNCRQSTKLRERYLLRVPASTCGLR